jgi:hypothetical protein
MLFVIGIPEDMLWLLPSAQAMVTARQKTQKTMGRDGMEVLVRAGLISVGLLTQQAMRLKPSIRG